MTDYTYHTYNFVKPVADLNAMRLNLVARTTKRIARKKGQHRGSSSHSDLYTDENPKGTIHGLKFATVQDAKDSVKKIESSGKSHAHKIQAAIAMEQRARVMGKVGPADVYRAYIEKMKKITKQRNESLNESKLYSKYQFTFSYKNKKVKMPIGDYFNYRYQRGNNEYSVINDIAKKLGLRKGRENLIKIERPKDVPVPSSGDIVIVNNKPYNVDRQKNHRDGNISFSGISTDTFVKEVIKNKNNFVRFEKEIDLYNDVDKIIKKDSSEYKKLISKMMNEDFTQRDVNDLEKFADRILKKYNIDVEFTKHFVDRLNDPRNSPAIKVSELQKFFKKIQRNKGRNIISNPDIEAVLKDMSTNLNLPVVIKTKGDSFEVTNKTIMRKPDFKTTSKVIKYESPPNTADAMKRYKSGKAGFTDKAHLKAKGLIPRADGTKRKSDKYK